MTTTATFNNQSRSNLGQSTANDVSSYMNWTCPGILYFYDFGPRAERNFPFLILFFSTFHMTCWRRTTGRLFSSNSCAFFSPVLPGRLLEHLAVRWSIGAPFFFKGYPLAVSWSTFSHRCPLSFHPFFSQ
jgi:hypothetical protein